MEKLTKGILGYIFSFLPLPIHSITCKLVCKRWNSIIKLKYFHSFTNQFEIKQISSHVYLTRTQNESILWDLLKQDCVGVYIGEKRDTEMVRKKKK